MPNGKLKTPGKWPGTYDQLCAEQKVSDEYPAWVLTGYRCDVAEQKFGKSIDDFRADAHISTATSTLFANKRLYQYYLAIPADLRDMVGKVTCEDIARKLRPLMEDEDYEITKQDVIRAMEESRTEGKALRYLTNSIDQASLAAKVIKQPGGKELLHSLKDGKVKKGLKAVATLLDYLEKEAAARKKKLAV